MSKILINSCIENENLFSGDFLELLNLNLGSIFSIYGNCAIFLVLKLHKIVKFFNFNNFYLRFGTCDGKNSREQALNRIELLIGV